MTWDEKGKYSFERGTNIQRAVIDLWECSIDVALLIHDMASGLRREQVQHHRKVEVGLCECWPAPPGAPETSTATDLLYVLFSPFSVGSHRN